MLKVLLIVIVMLLIAVTAAPAYFYYSALESLALSFKDDDLSLECGGDYPAMDQVASSEGEVTPETELLDSDTVGKKTLTYTVSKEVLGGLLRPEKEFVLEYETVDTAPPVMLYSGDGAVFARGSEFDIEKLVGYGDNADPDPVLRMEGEADMDKSGEYPLTITLSDSSGNETECSIKINVVDELPSSDSEVKKTPFRKFVKKQKGEGRSFGIDVSSWQGNVDFEAVRKAGCEFVFIRIGWSENGAVTFDEKFDRNLAGAKAAGLKTGIYLYSYDTSEEDVIRAVDSITEKLGGTELELPIAFDWEDFTHFQSYGISLTRLNRLYDAFEERLAEQGYDCMLYSSKNYLGTAWAKTDSRKIWLAHYTEKTDYKGPFKVWQAGCTGRIDGIDGDVDLDVMFY